MRSNVLYFWLLPLVCLTGLALIYWSDTNVTLFLMANHSAQMLPAFLWAHITILGDALFAPIFFTPFIRKRPDILWALIIASLVGVVLTHTIKPLAHQPRPAKVLGAAEFHSIGPRLRARAFPSGHTITVFTLASVAALGVRRRWLTVLGVGGASLIAYSRIAVGVHWPADIVAGAGLGWLAGASGYHLSKMYPWGARGVPAKIWALILVSICLLCLLLNHTKYPDIIVFQRIVAGIFLAVGLREFIILTRRSAP